MTTTPQPVIEINGLTRRFGNVVALDRVNLAIHRGEFFSLLGPSGCGKTTLLRILAGLDLADEGAVKIGGLDASNLPAHRRPVNTVFQSYALFPHLTVRDNIAFGLKMKKVPPDELNQRVESVMSLVEIRELEARRPNQLSGGQKQRVALARAIVNEPQVLLLDEPMGALDLKLRKQLQIELRTLQQRLGMTFIYVTHDQEEALVLSDRIAVMRAGQIEQLGEARDVYERPRTRFVGQFLGACSLIDATIQESNAEFLRTETPLGTLRVSANAPNRSRVTLAIRPEKVQLSATQPAQATNCIPVRVEQLIYVGAGTHYELRSGEQRLQADVMNHHSSAPTFTAGQQAWAFLPPAALVVLEDEYRHEGKA